MLTSRGFFFLWNRQCRWFFFVDNSQHRLKNRRPNGIVNFQ